MKYLALLALAACPLRTIHRDDPEQISVATKRILVDADLDILFVIDNSASTQDKQAVFAANFPKFVAALDAFPSGRPNLHIGVVSSTVGTGSDASLGPNCPKVAPADDGLLQNTPRLPSCTAPTGRFISDIGGSSGRVVNYAGTLESTLSCIAQLGTSGCGFEAQLEAMKRALDGSRPENAGFLRPGAFLAVIILTDEDDCSVKDPTLFDLPNAGPGDFRCQPLHAYTCDQPISSTTPGTYTNCRVTTGSYLHDPAEYYQFLATVKDPSQIVVASIAGGNASGGEPDPTIATGTITAPFMQALALEPSCTATINGNLAIARPGLRIDDFTRRFGEHGLFRTVCQADYSGALTDIGALLFNAISPCLEGALDTADADSNNPGLQPQCTVSDVVGTTESLLPACAMVAPEQPDPTAAKPCWWVKRDPIACGNAADPTHLELHVERTVPPASGTSIAVSCALAPR